MQQFSKEMIKAIVLFLLVNLLSGQGRNDPFKTLISYEEKQRASAEIDSSDYTLIPFKLADKSEHFVLAPVGDETLNIEVAVHWINSDFVLRFPQFDLAQKVRLTIEEQTFGAAQQKPIITKQFLTQTGFKLKLSGGKKYRMRIESVGKQMKLVEIAMTNKPKEVNAYEAPAKNHTSQMRILEEMKRNLQEARNRWEERTFHGGKEEKVSEIWAWMSGVQMVSLMAFVGLQIGLFERFSLPSSVI